MMTFWLLATLVYGGVLILTLALCRAAAVGDRQLRK